MSKRTLSLIACLQVIGLFWFLLLLLAISVFITLFRDKFHEDTSDIATMAMMIIFIILFFNVTILIGLKKRQTWSWYVCSIFLGLHLLGILLPLAVFGLIDLFSHEVEYDFGLARSPTDDDTHLKQLGP